MNMVLSGLDRLRDEYWKKLKGYKLGLLSNQASVDRNITNAKRIISQLLPGQLKALFGPQHGHGGEDQDNMVETPHGHDTETGVPVFSLYSEYREPIQKMLDILDLLIIDLQDVGTRVYTFASTMLNCLQSAAISDKRVLILDRPNPLGGKTVEGNLLQEELFSFVGPCSLPMRHGLTMGELAGIFNQIYNIECDLEILSLKGWERGMIWDDISLKWVMPSPNMPIPETAYVYPGQVIWEGTNISEGRGTCRPFEIFGAPFLNTSRIIQVLHPKAMQGCKLQEITFRPTFHKWTGELCRGFMIHITDHSAYQPYFTSLALLRAIIEIHGKSFQWRPPPYEYEWKLMPIDLILGNSALRKEIESGGGLSEIEERWLSECKVFDEWRTPHLLY